MKRSTPYWLLAGAAAIILVITMTMGRAADVPVKAVSQASVSANYFNGFYIQAGWGYGWSDSDPSVDYSSVNTKPPKYWWQSPKVWTSNESGSFAQRESGALIGGGVGFDWRIMQAVVAGAEVEWNKAWIKGSSSYSESQVTREIKSLGLVTGRVGVLVDLLFGNNPSPRHLLYIKGGGAWRTETITVTGELNGNNSNTDWGWVLGGGIESAISPSWRVRLEALHARFSDQNTPVTGTGLSGSTTSVYSGNVKTSDQLTWVSARLIWKPWN